MFEIFQSGGFMMWAILAVLFVIAWLAVRGMSDVRRGAPEQVRSTRDAVLFWGSFAAVLGVLGTVVGIAQAARAIEAAGSASPSLVWGGIQVTLVTTVFGLTLLSLAMLIGFALDVAERRVRQRS